MFDIDHERRKVVSAFELFPSQIELPEEWDDFFTQNGCLDMKFDDTRRYVRKFFRGKAILKRNGENFTAYTKDVSRMGIGLLFHEQLFPKEVVELWLPNRSRLTLQVQRCYRVQRKCYECGTIFSTSMIESSMT